MKPLVSILIPCFNAALWLKETLESALRQSWPSKEIILVDDGSTDQSLAIAESFAPRGVRIISQTNRGAATARNAALRTATGDFIQYLDADDLLDCYKIENQMGLLLNGPSTVVAAGQWARFYTSPAEAAFTPEALWKDMLPIDWLVTGWENNLMMHPAAWLVPRRIAELAGEWDESLSLNDDGEYFCRVVLSCDKVVFCETAKSFYRSDLPGSLSKLRSSPAWHSQFRTLELNADRLLAREDSGRTRLACSITFQRFIYEIYPHEPALQIRAQKKVRELGGCDLKPDGGPLFHLLSRMIGWKSSKRLKDSVYRLGYKRFALGRIISGTLGKAGRAD